MPKKKKQPKNAYYFFILDKKKEFEREGTRFRSIQDVFAMQDLRVEWKDMNPASRLKYEELAKQAKEADKVDLTNKFTCTGESYAQVNERQTQERREMNLKDQLLAELTMEGPDLNTRSFVLFKSLCVAEVGYSPETEYWPSELAIGAFNLEQGYLTQWWTLVDTGPIPLGYAASAKEHFELTRLPPPGSHKFKPAHLDHFKILNTLKRFIERYAHPINGYHVLFIKPAENHKFLDEGVLEWLLKKAKYENSELDDEFYNFFNRIKMIRVTKLLLKLAGVARGRTPTYNPPIAQFGHLENAATYVLGSCDFDYEKKITCAYHNLTTEDEESWKMSTCCRNIVLRSIFIMLRELVPPMGIQPKMTHIVQSMTEPAEYQIPPRPPPQEMSPPPSDDTASVPWDGGMCDMKHQRMVEKKEEKDPYYEPCPSTMGPSARRATQEAQWTVMENSGAAFEWGASAPLTPSFTTDDFPALGGTATGGQVRMVGRGRGFVTGQGKVGDGRPTGVAVERIPPKVEKMEDDWFEAPANTAKVPRTSIGRGVPRYAPPPGLGQGQGQRFASHGRGYPR